MKAWRVLRSTARLFFVFFVVMAGRVHGEEAPAVLLRQCRVLERYGHFPRLAAVAERLCRSAPRWPEAWRLRARALEELGREGGAREAWKRVLTLDEGHVEAICALATMDARHGALERAREALSRVAATERMRSSVQVAEAVLSHRRGHVPAAHRLLQQAMATAAGSSVPWLLRADLLVEEGRVDEACQTLSSLLRHRPEHPLVLSLRGMLRLREGSFQGAIDDLERALRLDEGAEKLYPLLIRAYEGLGQPSEALAVARMGLERHPENTHLSRLCVILSERLSLASRGSEERQGQLVLRWGQEVDEGRRRWLRKVLSLLHERAGHPFRSAGTPAPAEVRINFLGQVPRGMPAHYDFDLDELFVDSKLFGGESLVARQRAVAILLHELSHLHAFHAGGQRAFSRRALWLVEGLAELQARGLPAQGATAGARRAGTRPSDPIPGEDRRGEKILDGLSRSLAISTAVGDDLRRKAYRTAHRLVGRLVRSAGGLEAFLKSWPEALRRYGRGERHEQILEACWGQHLKSLIAER